MNDRDRQRREWLSGILAGRPSKVEVASVDASFRSYYRVHVDGITRILMDAPPPHEDCAPFVQVTAVLERAGVNVPAIVAEDLEQGFLLLTDLGDELYLGALDEASADTLYGDALDSLVRMQSHADHSSLPRYDEARLRQEMELFVDWFLRRHLRVEPDDEALGVLARSFDSLVAECLAQPQTFVHRDYHSRNLMVTRTRNPGILDYQDAVCGPAAYDLVSLLRDVYVQWPQQRIDGWLAAYFERALHARVLRESDRSVLPRWFDLTGVQRHLKVAGIFARLFHRDGKPRYLDDIPLTLHYLLSVAARYSELRDLSALLQGMDLTARHRARCDALRRAYGPDK